MTPPRLHAVRLLTRARDARTPQPLFGLRAWTASAEAVAVLLENQVGPNGVAEIAAQLPAASTLPSGTPVLVLGIAAARRGLWGLFEATLHVPRGARCSALLVRGYVGIGAGPDDVTGVDLTWGTAP